MDVSIFPTISDIEQSRYKLARHFAKVRELDKFTSRIPSMALLEREDIQRGRIVHYAGFCDQTSV
jgi:hypothetical protein